MDLGILGESNGKEKQTPNLNLIMVWIYFTTQYLVNFYGFFMDNFKTIAQTFCFFIFFYFLLSNVFQTNFDGLKKEPGFPIQSNFTTRNNIKIFLDLWQQFRPLTLILFLLFVGKCVLNKFDGLKRDTGCTINQNLTTEKQLKDLFLIFDNCKNPNQNSSCIKTSRLQFGNARIRGFIIMLPHLM